LSNWSDGPRLYASIAGILAGFVLLFIQMFLTREKPAEQAGETDNILLLLASVLFSMVGAAILFARAVMHVPQSAAGTPPAGLETALAIGLLATVPFSVGSVELTLCLGHLFRAYRTDAQAIRFVNVFLAALMVIGSVDYANAVDAAIRLRAYPALARTSLSLHFPGSLCAIVLPCLLVWHFGHSNGLNIVWLAYATLGVGTFAALFPIVLDSGLRIPFLGYVGLGYLMSLCLGVLFGACLACRPRAGPYSNSSTSTIAARPSARAASPR
jgi:hypothetical protein